MMNGSRKIFVAYNEIKGKDVIVVDGNHPQNLVLSHWKGSNTLEGIQADTSGEIVINAIEQNIEGIDSPFISATHFDIDGFVGVFALFRPDLAIHYKDVLIEMARIGDFREFEPDNPSSLHALKLCCWMNRLETEKFYRPFGEKDEIKSCVPKFEFFLNEFEAVLKDPEVGKEHWQEEANNVIGGLNEIENSMDLPEINGQIVYAQQAIHYYALFSRSRGRDIVISVYPENRYELEFKYTTWVDISSRNTLPRIDLRPLAEVLNQEETSIFEWDVDRITDTGPILRLEGKDLSKADRFANPTERFIYSSSIEPDRFIELSVKYLRNHYKEISPKRFWTWKEIKKSMD